jgi:hypothetical protein
MYIHFTLINCFAVFAALPRYMIAGITLVHIPKCVCTSEISGPSKKSVFGTYRYTEHLFNALVDFFI